MSLFKKLLGTSKPLLTNMEYWGKWKFFELVDLLHDAEKLLASYEGGYSGEFLSAKEFRTV